MAATDPSRTPGVRLLCANIVLTVRGRNVQIVATATRPQLAYAAMALDEPLERADPTPAMTGGEDEPILDARKVRDISRW
jgi:hypothetical protein